MSILLEIGAARFRLLIVNGLGGEDGEEGLDSTGIEFPATLLRPFLGQVAIGKQTLGEGMKSLFGVEPIDDLDGLREEFPGQVPDPLGSVPQDDLPLRSLKTASQGFALDSLSRTPKAGDPYPKWRRSRWLRCK